MTKEQIDTLVQEAGIVVVGEAVYKLCQLVAAAGRADENEACAQIVHDTYEGFGVNAKGIQYVKQRIIKQIEERRKK